MQAKRHHYLHYVAHIATSRLTHSNWRDKLVHA